MNGRDGCGSRLELMPGDLPPFPASLRRRVAALLPPSGQSAALSGVCPGARALAVAALAERHPGSTVAVPSARDAEELVAGLAVLAPDLPAAEFPAEALENYLGSPAPLGATAAAARALLALHRGDLRVLVLPARVLAFPLPDPGALVRRAPVLRTGDFLDRQRLTGMLVSGGYRRVEVAEEPGEFAVRGQVLDIITPDASCRLLLDVDTIESIHRFDPATQRSDEVLALVAVAPLQLFPAEREDLALLAGWLDGHGCEAGAAAAREETRPGVWQGFLGAVQPHLRAWELTPHLVVVEPEAVALEWERLFSALGRARQVLAGEGTALPAPERWLVPLATGREALRQADQVVELGIGDATPWVALGTRPTPALAARPQALLEEVRTGVASRWRQAVVVSSAGEAQRFANLLAEADLPVREGWPDSPAVGLVTGDAPRGFAWPRESFALFGRADVTTLPAPRRQRRSLATVLAEMRELAPGDFVVHVDHGIGRFVGFRTVAVEGESHECVHLEYAGGGTLLVPLERADTLEKFGIAEGAPPRLDRLGGGTWSRTRARVKRALKDMAAELLKVQAGRQQASGFAFSKDSPWQRQFEEAFEWELTPDQELATQEVKRDMESHRPMDRLLVGDVGYGKTEVAMRAAFKAVMDGKQVAVLTPTTILAEQHLRVFVRRFAGFPVEIRGLSRFQPAVRQRAVVAGLGEGTVDIVIGTHRLLAADVVFRDLGLLVVDEEQRFGVAQKERLKALTVSVDVLALSATPIPRSLNLGLLGLRDVSIIETPPRDRLAVQTHVLPFRREAVREAVLVELARGGQVYFVHNRVASIGAIATLLRDVVPEARLAVAHGQMAERELERAMTTFVEHRADVLLSTAIIENGLDIANANTLIVNRADRFGLAQLYQLRGRVGRSDRLAFAHLLVPPERSLSQEARQRLAAIVEFAELGAGFRIAARDLEIRGAGNLLGAEQHGHLRAVGYETYCQLLEEAVRELRGEEAPPPTAAVELRLGMDLRLPEQYIGEESLRLAVYRRVAAARSDDEIDLLAEELADRFGPPPPTLHHLLLHQRLRRRAEGLGITRIRRTTATLEIVLDGAFPGVHALAMDLLAAVPGSTLSPSGVLRLPTREVREPAAGAVWLLACLPNPAPPGP